jgi:hypothetical protein
MLCCLAICHIQKYTTAAFFSLLAVLIMEKTESSGEVHNMDQQRKAPLTNNESILELLPNLKPEVAISSACFLLHDGFFLVLLIPDDACGGFLRNDG